MLKYAKANPGKLNYSSAGIGTLPHVTMELLLRRADVQVAHVAYKGAAPALTDLLAGVVQLKYDTYATSAPHLATGKLKVLATAGTTRLTQLPDVPTVAESGFPGYQGYLWIGAVAPEQDAGGSDHDAVRGVREGGAHAEGRRTPARGGGRGRGQHARGVRPDHRRRAQALVAAGPRREDHGVRVRAVRRW